MKTDNEKTIRRLAWSVFILILLFAGAFITACVLYRQAKTRELELLLQNGELANIVAQKRQAVDSAKARIEVIEARIDNVGAAFKDVTDSLTGLIKGKDRTIATLKVALRPQIDLNPDLRDLILNQDSATFFRDSLISALQAQNLAQFNDFTEIVRIQRFEIEQHAGMAATFEQSSNEFQRRYEKAEKKLKRRWSMGPAASYGISKEGLSPSLGIGIQFSLIRF